MIARLKKFLDDYQELFIWLPVIFAVLLFTFYLLPRIDPRAGIDGWGELWDTQVVVFKACVGTFLAWLFKKTYLSVLSDKDEQALRAEILQGNQEALRLLYLDRLEWLVLLAFTYFSLHR